MKWGGAGLESERFSVTAKRACWFGTQKGSKLNWLKKVSEVGVVGWLVWFWLTFKGIYSFEVCPSFPFPGSFVPVTVKNI